jgi:hypothetical protein
LLRRMAELLVIEEGLCLLCWYVEDRGKTHRRLVLLEGKRSVYRYTLHSSLNRSPTA